MEWMEHFFSMPFLCGGIFIVAGIVVYLFPPKKINAFYGYRTTNSMSSIEKWHFSQRYSSLRMIESGAFLIAFSGLGMFAALSQSKELIAGFSGILLAVCDMLLRTEKALKTRFPNQA